MSSIYAYYEYLLDIHKLACLNRALDFSHSIPFK